MHVKDIKILEVPSILKSYPISELALHLSNVYLTTINKNIKLGYIILLNKYYNIIIKFYHLKNNCTK